MKTSKNNLSVILAWAFMLIAFLPSLAQAALSGAVNQSSLSYVNAGRGFTLGTVTTVGECDLVMVRVLGPALAPLGVPDVLKDPVLYASDMNHKTSSPLTPVLLSDEDVLHYQQVLGASPIVTRGNGDLVKFFRINPGVYSFQVGSASNSSGYALAEIYLIDQSQKITLSAPTMTGPSTITFGELTPFVIHRTDDSALPIVISVDVDNNGTVDVSGSSSFARDLKVFLTFNKPGVYKIAIQATALNQDLRVDKTSPTVVYSIDLTGSQPSPSNN